MYEEARLHICRAPRNNLTHIFTECHGNFVHAYLLWSATIKFPLNSSVPSWSWRQIPHNRDFHHHHLPPSSVQPKRRPGEEIVSYANIFCLCWVLHLHRQARTRWPSIPQHFSIPVKIDNNNICWSWRFLREEIHWKKTFSFGHCPNYLTPPPWPQFKQLGPLPREGGEIY